MTHRPELNIFDSCTSTNSIAMAMGREGARSGTGVLAFNQTAGRGRLGKKWISAENKGLYCSIIVRPRIEPSEYPKLTMVAGLGVRGTLQSFLVGKKVELKWPNDVFVRGKKCAGILCESGEIVRPERFCVIGIGVNIRHAAEDFPDELSGSSTSLALEGGPNVGTVEMYWELHRCVLEKIRSFEQHGFEPLLAEWRNHDFLVGRELECVNPNGEIVRGRSLGPDANGILHLVTKDGGVHEVISGDIRLGIPEEMRKTV